MIYYNRYPQDYDRDTSGLSLVEHGAYTILLDRYYSADGKLSAEIDSLYRVCRAQSEDEKQAVAMVVKTYFSTGRDGCLKHKRAELEIKLAKYRSEIARDNGRKGGRHSVNTVLVRKPSGVPSGLAKPNPTLKLNRTQTKAIHRSSGISQEGNSPFESARAREPQTETAETGKPDFEAEFSDLWKTYPRPEGHKEALRHFNATVKTPVDLVDIRRALQNYILQVEGKEIRWIKQGGTWFNNWRDYVNGPIVQPRPSDGSRPQRVSTTTEPPDWFRPILAGFAHERWTQSTHPEEWPWFCAWTNGEGVPSDSPIAGGQTQ